MMYLLWVLHACVGYCSLGVVSGCTLGSGSKKIEVPTMSRWTLVMDSLVLNTSVEFGFSSQVECFLEFGLSMFGG